LYSCVIDKDATDRFRAILRQYFTDVPVASADMATAVASVATAARLDGLSAEHFVIWVKNILDETKDEGAFAAGMDPASARDVVISAAIKAYYVQ
ncbi:MAG: hypothetical protein ACHQQP_04480, partial [Gemmatimonadales bacterium]